MIRDIVWTVLSTPGGGDAQFINEAYHVSNYSGDVSEWLYYKLIIAFGIRKFRQGEWLTRHHIVFYCREFSRFIQDYKRYKIAIGETTELRYIDIRKPKRK